jgi:hypothetical protein
MATGLRVQRLRDMVDQIERLPASPDRDRLLSEIRSRAVDVDTGVTPRSMLPLREPEPDPEPAAVMPRPAKRERAKIIRPAAPRTPAPSAELAARSGAASPTEHPEQWPSLSGRLSLEDTLQPQVRVSGNRTVPPWTLGLRG